MIKSLKEEIEQKNIIIMSMEQENVMKEYKKNSIKPGENLNILSSVSKQNKINNDNENKENNTIQSKKSNIIENYLNSNLKPNTFGVKRKFGEFNKKYEERNNNINIENENANNKDLTSIQTNQENKENLNGTETKKINFLDYQNVLLNENENTPNPKIIEECNSSFLKKNLLTYKKDDKIILNSKNNIAIEFERINKPNIPDFQIPLVMSKELNVLKENTNNINNQTEENNNFNVFIPRESFIKNNNLLQDNFNNKIASGKNLDLDKNNYFNISNQNDKENCNDNKVNKNNNIFLNQENFIQEQINKKKSDSMEVLENIY